MRFRPFALVGALLATLVPLVPGAVAWTCVPAEDQSASTIGAGVETYYNKLYSSSSARVEEVWQETNGEPGLQTSTGMSCVAQADRLVQSVCVGCPLQS
jgi:hypothetical protein